MLLQAHHFHLPSVVLSSMLSHISNQEIRYYDLNSLITEQRNDDHNLSRDMMSEAISSRHKWRQRGQGMLQGCSR